jgi:hypothetical protein
MDADGNNRQGRAGKVNSQSELDAADNGHCSGLGNLVHVIAYR